MGEAVYGKSTYILGENKVGLEVAMGILTFTNSAQKWLENTTLDEQTCQ